MRSKKFSSVADEKDTVVSSFFEEYRIIRPEGNPVAKNIKIGELKPSFDVLDALVYNVSSHMSKGFVSAVFAERLRIAKELEGCYLKNELPTDIWNVINHDVL